MLGNHRLTLFLGIVVLSFQRLLCGLKAVFFIPSSFLSKEDVKAKLLDNDYSTQMKSFGKD